MERDLAVETKAFDQGREIKKMKPEPERRKRTEAKNARGPPAR